MKRSIFTAIATAVLVSSFAAPGQAQSYTDQQLIVKWIQADASCRGHGPSRKAYPEACGVRARYAGALNERGWCHDGQISIWTPCLALKPKN